MTTGGEVVGASHDGSEFDLRPTTFGGRRVIEKSGSARSRSRLRREAAALEQLRSNGVVELVELRESESRTTLVTAYVGARTLADASRLQPREILRALREVCRIVIDLHDRGWSHGNISAEHVILGPRARVRLCSLGDAVALDVTAMQVDAASVAGSPVGTSGHSVDLDDSSDLQQMIKLIGEICGLPVSGNSIRERREWRRMRSHLSRAVSSTLDSFDAPARSADSCSVSGEGLLHLASCLEVDSGESPRAGRSRSPRRRRGPVETQRSGVGASTRSSPASHLLRYRGLAFTVGVVAAGVVLLAGFVPGDAGGDRRPKGPHPKGPAVATDGQASADQADSRPPSGDTADREGVSVPHDSAGNLVVSNGKIYRIGAEGDRVVVGDWNCDGTESALLLRPSSGEVYLFREWASEGRPSAAELVSVIEGATDLHGPDGECGPAIVQTESGARRQLVPTEP